MGYCYDSSGRLACDSCGKVGGVRKRTCPHKVDGLPYCPAPALCSDCFKAEGGLAVLHRECKALAEKRQREEDDLRAHVQAGRLVVKSAVGSWHKTVPAGMVGVTFAGLSGQERRLVPEADYHPIERRYLDQYPTTHPWAA